jgi:formate hydrogenlyase transcriptional activator
LFSWLGLTKRLGDIPLLVHFLVNKFAGRVGKRIESVDAATMQRLVEYPWPGNIRELENTLERAVILANGPVLTVEPDVFSIAEPPRDSEHAAEGSLAEIERDHVLSVLQKTDWAIEGERGAAKILGLHPNTLRSRLKRLGISRETHGSS